MIRVLAELNLLDDLDKLVADDRPGQEIQAASDKLKREVLDAQIAALWAGERHPRAAAPPARGKQ